MAILKDVPFIIQFKGDGASSTFVVDLTKDNIVLQGAGGLNLPSSFSPLLPVSISNVLLIDTPVTATILGNVVTFIFSSPPLTGVNVITGNLQY